VAVPIDPTLDEIVRDGMELAGTENPDPALVTLASERWMPQLKREIHLLATGHKDLRSEKVIILKKAVSRYSLLTLIADFESLITAKIMDGDDESDRGTVVAATASTISLRLDDARSAAEREGREIVILSGNAEGAVRTGLVWDASLKKYTSLSANWTLTPDVGSKYLVNTRSSVYVKDPLDMLNDYIDLDYLEQYEMYGSELWTSYVPEKDYGLRVFYYANLNKIDVDSAQMTRLYNLWHPIWVQGICYKESKRKDDVRQKDEYANFLGLVKALKNKTSLGGTYKTSGGMI
jgi:hypothetical protein